MPKKVCSKCKIEKEIICFGTRYNKPREQCKECEKQYRDERKKTAKIKYELLLNERKICTKCNIEKSGSEFHFHQQAGLRPQCKECVNKNNKEYRDSHSEETKQRSKEYYQKNRIKCNKKAKNRREDNLEKYREMGRKSYEKNKDHQNKIKKEKRDKNPEEHRARSKKYYEKHKEEAILRAKKRRDKKKELDFNFTIKDKKIILEKFDNKCFNCDSTEKLSIDHHMPLSLGFGLTIENAVLLCKKCNSSKHNKHPKNFYTKEQLLKLETLGIINHNE